MYVSFPAAVTGSSPGCALHFWLGVTLNGMFPSFPLERYSRPVWVPEHRYAIQRMSHVEV